MGYRRSRGKTKEHLAWKAFCDQNRGLINLSPLPPIVFDTEAAFHDLLKHGYVMGIDYEFTTDPMLAPMKQLLERYFEAGNVATIHGLAASDQDYFKRKYGDQVGTIVGNP